MVLLVVDAQRGITNTELYQFQLFKSHVRELIELARQNHVEVVFVRHDDGPGTVLTKGAPGFEIYEGFSPVAGERIFDKTVNSAFRGTGLGEYLREKGEDTIIVVGLQTEYCIDATVKCGFEHGFTMIVPEGCNSTFDNDFMSAEKTYHYYNDFMWNRRYARCVSFDETAKLITKS